MPQGTGSDDCPVRRILRNPPFPTRQYCDFSVRLIRAGIVVEPSFVSARDCLGQVRQGASEPPPHVRLRNGVSAHGDPVRNPVDRLGRRIHRDEVQRDPEACKPGLFHDAKNGLSGNRRFRHKGLAPLESHLPLPGRCATCRHRDASADDTAFEPLRNGVRVDYACGAEPC